MAAALPDNDGALVRLAVDGDDDAFAALYHRYFPAVFDFLTRLLRDREEAADVAQDTFIKALEQLPTIRKPERFKSWIFTIAHRQGLNRIRRASRMSPGSAAAIDDEERATMAIADPDPTVNPERMAAIQEAADIVWEAAAGLDPRTYAVMDLHIRHGLASAEIAEVMGVTKANAYTMVNRMKRVFSNTLATYMLVRKGRQDCQVLAGVIPPETEEMTPELRKQADRHVARCDVCAANRVLLVAPMRIFATLLLVPIPAGLKASIWGTLGTGAAAGAGAAAVAQAGGAATGAGAGGGAVGGGAASGGMVAGVQGWVIAVACAVGLAATVATGTFVFGDSDTPDPENAPPVTAAAADLGEEPATAAPTTIAPVAEEPETTPVAPEDAPVALSPVVGTAPPPTITPPPTTLPPPPTTLPPPTTTLPPPTTTLPPPTTTTLPPPPPTTLPPTTTTLPPPTTTLPPPTTTLPPPPPTVPPPPPTVPPSPHAAIVDFAVAPGTIYATIDGTCPQGQTVSTVTATVDNPDGIDSMLVDYRQREPAVDKGQLSSQLIDDRIVAQVSVSQGELGGLDQVHFDVRVRMTDMAGTKHEVSLPLGNLLTVLRCPTP